MRPRRKLKKDKTKNKTRKKGKKNEKNIDSIFVRDYGCIGCER